MKHIIAYAQVCALFISFMLVLLGNQSYGQWVQTNGIVGAGILSLGINDSNIFAGTNDNGVFRSTNAGTGWNHAGFDGGRVFALAFKDSSIFIASYGSGVLRSTDNGINWIPTGITPYFTFSLAVSDTTLFVGTQSNGVYRSSDNGDHWTQINAGLTNMTVYSMIVSGSNLFAATNGGGVFLSTDNGSSWTGKNSGLTNPYVRTLAMIGANLYGGTSGGGVFLSTNNGTSWTDVSIGLTGMEVRAIAGNGTDLFAGTFGDGVFLSTNNGTSWSEVNTGLDFRLVSSLALYNTGIIAGTSGGVFLSTNSGASWTDANAGLTPNSVRAFTASGANLFSVAYGGGAYRSTNSGSNWTRINNGIPNPLAVALTVSGTSVFAGASGVVYLSTNDGSAWTPASSGLPCCNLWCLVARGTNIFAGIYFGGVYRSSDNGVSWTGVNSGLTNNVVVTLAVRGSSLFAGTSGGGVFRSTDDGTNWTAVNTGLFNFNIQAFAAAGPNLFVGTYGGGIFLTTDDGTSWNAVNTGITDLNVTALTNAGSNLFAGTFSSGIFLSTDNGSNWAPIDTGLTDLSISALAINANFVLAGTSSPGRVWRRLLSEVIPNAPLFSISGASLSFGDVVIGSGLSDSVIITNTGLQTLVIDSIRSTNSNFSAILNNTNLAPSDSGHLVVTFTPTSIGPKNGRVIIYHNATPYADTLDLSGNGSQALFSALPTHISFGFVHKDSTKTDSILVTNTGNANLVIDSVRVVGGEFSVIPNAAWTLGPAVSKRYTFTFAPTTFGSQTGKIKFWHSGPSSPDSLSVTGTSRQALFSATPAVILFGDVPKNSVKPDSVALTNIGDTTLFIDSVRVIGGQFSVLPNGLSALAVAGTQKYTVSFAPTSEGTQTGKVVFWHSGPSSHDTVHLIGTGTVPLFSAAPESLSFGAVLADSTKKDSVTVRNIGTAPLIISSVSSNDPELTVIPTSVTIAPSDSQKFYLTFSPLSQYFTRSDTLTFTHNATGSPARIFCSATGVGTLVDSVRAGWNMRSVPLLLGDYRRVSLFPASSSAFAYRGSYEIRDTLQNGTGYWIKFASPQTVQITGLPVARESIDVRANWNMVGSISSTIAVNTLASMPGGIVTSKFYSYSGSYVASDSIRPGHAYWVKVNQAGKLILTATPSIVPANWIRIELSPETPPDPPEAEISNLKSEIPDQFALEQNYPNPFNPVTFIRYSLPVTIHVTLKVYNTLGQEVRTLIDGAQEPGYKAAEFDASALPSGIYFYRLTAGSFSGTRKLILTK